MFPEWLDFTPPASPAAAAGGGPVILVSSPQVCGRAGHNGRPLWVVLIRQNPAASGTWTKELT
jgi:hypothetical protein